MIIQCSQVPEVKKEIESLIKVITEHLTRGLEITLNPHWPISSSEDQLVNPYDLFAVDAKYMFTLFRTAPSISLHCLGQRTNCTPSCFKPFIGNCNRANSRYSNFFCVLGVQTKFILQIKSVVQAIPC